MSRFIDALRSGRVLLMDGAMGTELQRAGVAADVCLEFLNVSDPAQVRAIHEAYARAGAEVFLTNTFQAHPVALARHGLGGRAEEIVRAAVTSARTAVGRSKYVVLTIGPTLAAGPDFWTGVARASSEADAILFETLSDLRLLEDLGAAQGPWNACKLPVLLSFTFSSVTSEAVQATSALEIAVAAERFGAAALGVNCGRDLGLDAIIEILADYGRGTRLPLFARPNAGTPARTAQSWTFPHSPASMSAWLPRLLQAGATMIGGCCGTTPEHIALFRPILDHWNAQKTVSG